MLILGSYLFVLLFRFIFVRFSWGRSFSFVGVYCYGGLFYWKILIVVSWMMGVFVYWVLLDFVYFFVLGVWFEICRLWRNRILVLINFVISVGKWDGEKLLGVEIWDVELGGCCWVGLVRLNGVIGIIWCVIEFW